MDIKILEEKENPFFKRKELIVEIEHPKMATPSKTELIKELATSQKVEESQVVIDYIFTKTGASKSKVKVKILEGKPKERKGEKTETQTNKTE